MSTRCYALFVVLVLTSQALAGRTDIRMTDKIGPEEVADRTRRVVEDISWHYNQRDALRVAEEEGKPLLWLQLVGDLDGGL